MTGSGQRGDFVECIQGSNLRHGNMVGEVYEVRALVAVPMKRKGWFGRRWYCGFGGKSLHICSGEGYLFKGGGNSPHCTSAFHLLLRPKASLIESLRQPAPLETVDA